MNDKLQTSSTHNYQKWLDVHHSCLKDEVLVRLEDEMEGLKKEVSQKNYCLTKDAAVFVSSLQVPKQGVDCACWGQCGRVRISLPMCGIIFLLR